MTVGDKVRVKMDRVDYVRGIFVPAGMTGTITAETILKVEVKLDTGETVRLNPVGLERMN